MKKKPLVIFLVGPTASGKSEVAVELSQMLSTEIISADSMQVYRGIDILNAKPTQKQMNVVPHHLINFFWPDQEYSAAVFCKYAKELILDICKRNKVPFIVGGTGMYIKTLTKGLFSAQGKSDRLRAKLYQQAERNGNLFLYQKLEHIDPEAAKNIHQNDLLRIVRALEAYIMNKTPISKLRLNSKGIEGEYHLLMFGIKWDRKLLYQRIEQRVDLMFSQGIVQEVMALSKVNLSKSAANALGIKQIKDYFLGQCSLEEANLLLKRDTRRFAKRQLTWFRQNKDILWIEANESDSAKIIANKILTFLH